MKSNPKHLDGGNRSSIGDIVGSNAKLEKQVKKLRREADLWLTSAKGYAAIVIYEIGKGKLDSAWHYLTRGFRKHPLDTILQRLVLDFGLINSAPEVLDHVLVLAAHATQRDILNDAVRIRYGNGRLRGADTIARLEGSDNEIQLAIWTSSPDPFHVELGDNHRSIKLQIQPEADHPLAPSFGFGALLRVAWPESFTHVIGMSPERSLCWVKRTIVRPGLTLPIPKQHIRGHQREFALNVQSRTTRVVIPVYGNAAETSACIQSVLNDGEDPGTREIVVVNDASPDPNMPDVLDQAYRAGAIILTNPVNLGFIGSVNRAVSGLGLADTVLLNSDTLVSPGWLSRLRSVAAEDIMIGTVTPLSNNGETVSVPRPFQSNPPKLVGLGSLNERLWKRFGTQSIDIPSGIGFCLFIKEPVLRTIGLIDSAGYTRGYLEDIDFCLRAAAFGFRNVCSLGVYVSHQGGLSFGPEKAYLVALNSRTLEKRFPNHEHNYRNFVRADPLRLVRRIRYGDADNSAEG